jgi:hypothetical protein
MSSFPLDPELQPGQMAYRDFLFNAPPAIPDLNQAPVDDYGLFSANDGLLQEEINRINIDDSFFNYGAYTGVQAGNPETVAPSASAHPPHLQRMNAGMKHMALMTDPELMCAPQRPRDSILETPLISPRGTQQQAGFSIPQYPPPPPFQNPEPQQLQYPLRERIPPQQPLPEYQPQQLQPQPPLLPNLVPYPAPVTKAAPVPIPRLSKNPAGGTFVKATGPVSHDYVLLDAPKPGRKPIEDDGGDRRRKQNRLAQRKFRDQRVTKAKEALEFAADTKKLLNEKEGDHKREKDKLEQTIAKLQRQLARSTK